MAEENEIALTTTNKAALSVLLAPTFFGTLIMMFLYKDEYVHFYAIQILLLGAIIFVLQWAFKVTGLNEINGLLFVVGFGLWLLLIYKAWLGNYFSIPLIGDLTKRLMKKK